jgi:hypothetical protein
MSRPRLQLISTNINMLRHNPLEDSHVSSLVIGVMRKYWIPLKFPGFALLQSPHAMSELAPNLSNWLRGGLLVLQSLLALDSGDWRLANIIILLGAFTPIVNSAFVTCDMALRSLSSFPNA